MPARRGRRKPFKLKLKKKTVYTIFAIGFLFAGIFLLLSFVKHDGGTAKISGALSAKFGQADIFSPFVLIAFGFLFLHLKFYLSKLNVTIGYSLFFVSLLGLMRGGSVGGRIFDILSEIITKQGADILLLAGLLVGIIVFFDTSVDEILQALLAIMKGTNRMVPRSIFGMFKRDKTLGRDKPMMIKGGQKHEEAV